MLRRIRIVSIALLLLVAALPVVAAPPWSLGATQSAIAYYDSVIQRVSDHVKVWYFYLSTCPYCRKQEPVLSAITRHYGIPVQPISLDGGAPPGGEFSYYIKDTGQAAQLGVLATPTLYLVNTNDRQAVQITSGFVSGATLMERMVWAARQAGWLKGSQSVGVKQ